MVNHTCRAALALALALNLPARAMAQAGEPMSPAAAAAPDAGERAAWAAARAQVERSMAETAASYRASGQCGSPELDVAISRPMELLSQAVEAAGARAITPARTVELVGMSGEGLLRLGDLALSAGCPVDAQGIYAGVMATFPEAGYPAIAARAREGVAAAAMGNLSPPAAPPASGGRVPPPPSPGAAVGALHGY